jgi:hypothetical protein
MLTKIPVGYEPIVLLSANVMAFGFHDAFEQNFGRLYETAEKT